MNDHEIEEGRDGWGSHLAPPEPPCGCVVQDTVQSESVCTGDCTAHCTGDCTTRRMTLVGVRGGSGTSTIGAAFLLISRTMVRTELVTADPVLTSALLGVDPPDQLPAEVLGRLVLAQEASGEAELTIIDAGTVTEASVGPRASGERRLGVLRGARATSHSGRCSQASTASMGSSWWPSRAGPSTSETPPTSPAPMSSPPCPSPLASLAPSMPASSLPVTRASASSAISVVGSLPSSTPSRPVHQIGEPLHQTSPKWQAQTCQLRFAHLARAASSGLPDSSTMPIVCAPASKLHGGSPIADCDFAMPAWAQAPPLRLAVARPPHTNGARRAEVFFLRQWVRRMPYHAQACSVALSPTPDHAPTACSPRRILRGMPNRTEQRQQG